MTVTNISHPVTRVVTFTSGPPGVALASEVAWEYDAESGLTEFIFFDGVSSRSVFATGVEISEVEERVDAVTRNGNHLVIREITESDAVPADVRSFSLPLPVLYAVARGEHMDTGTLQVAVDNRGNVATVLLFSPEGLFARYSSMWHAVSDVASLDGLALVETGDTTVDLYDNADSRGQQISALGLPEIELEDVFDAMSVSTSPPVTASAMIELPIIRTLADVPAAIERADNDKAIRWYVERRAKALDPTMDMPW
jgi:hypothetical protein